MASGTPTEESLARGSSFSCFNFSSKDTNPPTTTWRHGFSQITMSSLYPFATVFAMLVAIGRLEQFTRTFHPLQAYPANGLRP